MSKSNLLVKQLQEIKDHSMKSNMICLEVSQVSIAWHLDHSLKVINGICDTLKASDPQTYKENFNLARLFCYTFNYIPRGKAKAPKSVRPPEVIRTTDILSQLQTAKEKLEGIANLNDAAHFRHPYFDELNKKQAIQFLQLHTNHHLKIVRDILKVSS